MFVSRVTSASIVLSAVGAVALGGAIGYAFYPAAPPPASVPISCAVETAPKPETAEQLYLDLLKKTLTRAQVVGAYELHPLRPRGVAGRVYPLIDSLLASKGFGLVRFATPQVSAYMDTGFTNMGQARNEDGETMCGLKQLDNVQFCVTDVLQRKIPGDVIEAGAWRGGITILMRAVLKAYGDQDRSVWVADSFEGLPPVNSAVNPGPWRKGLMSASLEEVRENFARFGLLDTQVRFLKGYFNKTLPGAPIGKLAVLRSDADLYDSTKDVLNNLYPKLSVGGYAILDDYYISPGCRKAIDEYRALHGITEPMTRIDSNAVFWRREK